MTRTYGRLSRLNGKWVIPELEPHVCTRLKAIFPKVPKTGRPPYILGDEPATASDIAWFVSRYALEMDDDVAAALAAGAELFEAQQAEVGRIMAADWVPRTFAGLRAGQSVRPHQARNVELLARFAGLLVGDAIGEGKTYTGAAACLIPGALPATIVCPPNLAIQWREKLQEFTELTVHVVTKTRPYRLPPVDVRIFGFTQLAGWIDQLAMLGTGLVIYDEGHELRRGPDETDKGRAAIRLSQLARMRMMLTGTAIFNYGDEIWNLMRFVRPEVLGEWDAFRIEWCSGREVTDPEALGTYLREVHAMTRKVGQGPQPNRIVETVPHDADRLARAEGALRALAKIAYTGGFTERGKAVRELDLRLRLETGIAKAYYVAKYVRMLVEAGEPVVLFGWHRAVYDVWLEELEDLGVVMYTGSETAVQKNQAKHRFLDGSAKVMIMSLRSGAGLDGIQHVARTVVFGELDWSPAMHDQCIGRVNREGQACWPDQVNAIFLVADDGSDPPMMEVLGVKASQAHNILDPGLGPQKASADRKPLERLIARYLGEEKVA